MNTIRIHDVSSNETIDREMNEEEIKLAEKMSAESIKSMKNAEKEKAAKAALLERLGITADEAALLLK